MMGSCCEEQEAREAERRSQLRAGAQWNESRMMRGHRVREELHRSLRCADACCAGCGECEEEDDEPAAPAREASTTSDGTSDDDDDGSFDDDGEEAALMAKMRAARMGQMQAGAEVAARRQAARGVHARLREGESLASVLADREDGSPIVLHLANAADDATAEAGLWVEDALKKAADGFPLARLITEVRSAREAPSCLPAVGAVPALVVVESGRVTAQCVAQWDELREPQVRQLVGQWLEEQRVRLVREARERAERGDDDSGDEADADAPLGYCGRPGCRTYFHEHVTGARKPELLRGDDGPLPFRFAT